MCALNAVGLLNNLALEKKFRIEMRGKLENAVLPAFEKLLREGCSQKNVLPTCVTTMTNLSADQHIRKVLTNRKETWEALVHCLKTCGNKLSQAESVSTLNEALGLLLNMTLEKSEMSGKFSVSLCRYGKFSQNSAEFFSIERKCEFIV